MRRITLACVLALLALGGTAQAQQCNGCGIGYWYAGLPLTGGTLTGPLVTPSGTVSSLAAAYSKRTYDGVVVVSTTITAALAGISTASYANRYLVYVPNGTYTEEITMKDWVDVVGESRTGVILTSASAAAHTVGMDNVNAMLSTMTVRHTANAKYPIHADTNGGWTVIDPTVEGIVYNVTAESSGTNPAIGVGLWARQRFYLISSSFSATANDAVFIHNSLTQPLATQAVLIDVTATSPTNSGFMWQNIGSGRGDYVSIVGGTFSGKDDAGNEDIAVENSGAGAGEAYISIDTGATYSTLALVAPAKRLVLPTEASLPALPQFTTPGVAWTADGYLKVDTRVTTAQLMIGATGYVDAGFGTDFRLTSFGAFYTTTGDSATLGKSGQSFSNGFVDRSIQGSKSKALTDAAAAAAVIRVPIASNSYQGGTVIWNAQSTDATDYRTTTGTIRWAGISKAATPTCTVNVVDTDLTASSNANTLACTWTNVVSTTNCDLSVTCTDNTAGSQTMTINFRADMPTLSVLVFP